MMEKILLADYIKSKKNILLKISVPLILVFASYHFSFGNFALIMIIIFTIITGAGLKIVQLKTNGVYDRLIVSPITKKRLFFEMTSVYIFLYYFQFLPSLLVGVYYNNTLWLLLFSFLAIAVAVLIGTLVGIHAKTLGQIHLNSLVVVLPIVAVAMIDVKISYLFPFIYVTRSIYSVEGLLLSIGIIFGVYLLLIADVSRL